VDVVSAPPGTGGRLPDHSLTRDRKTLAATSKTTVVTFGSELRLQIGLTCSPNAAEPKQQQ